MIVETASHQTPAAYGHFASNLWCLKKIEGLSLKGIQLSSESARAFTTNLEVVEKISTCAPQYLFPEPMYWHPQSCRWPCSALPDTAVGHELAAGAKGCWGHSPDVGLPSEGHGVGMFARGRLAPSLFFRLSWEILSNYDILFQLPVEGYHLLLNAVQPSNCLHQLHFSLTKHPCLLWPGLLEGFRYGMSLQEHVHPLWQSVHRPAVWESWPYAVGNDLSRCHAVQSRYLELVRAFKRQSFPNFHATQVKLVQRNIYIRRLDLVLWLQLSKVGHKKIVPHETLNKAMEHYTDGTDLKRVMPLPYFALLNARIAHRNGSMSESLD